MHRHVRRVGHQRAVMGKHRAGEIQPLLDVDRVGGVLQRHAHLLGDRHEKVVEHLQHYWIGMGADGVRALEFFRARQHEMVLSAEFGLPARFDHDGLVRFDDDGGAFHCRVDLELTAGENIGLMPFTRREKICAPRRRRQFSTRALDRLLAELGAAADRLHRHRFHHHLLATIDEAEARLVGFLEGALHRGQGACAPYECSVGPSVADMRAHEDFDLPRRHALAGDFGFHHAAERGADALDGGERLVAEGQFDCLLARGADIGQPHAIGRQQR